AKCLQLLVLTKLAHTLHQYICYDLARAAAARYSTGCPACAGAQPDAIDSRTEFVWEFESDLPGPGRCEGRSGSELPQSQRLDEGRFPRHIAGSPGERAS